MKLQYFGLLSVLHFYPLFNLYDRFFASHISESTWIIAKFGNDNL